LNKCRINARLAARAVKIFISYNAVTTGDDALTQSGLMEGKFSMRFIRGCVIAAGYVLVFLGSARAVTIGDTAVLSASDNGNGNLLVVQSATLG